MEEEKVLVKGPSRIGTGSSSIVYPATWNQKPAAVKVFNYDTKKANFDREVAVLSKVKHPRIIELYEIITKSYSYELVLELGSDNLDSWIYSYQKPCDMKWAIQIAEGVLFLHGKKFLYLDLKPSNIVLVNGNQDIKLIDFTSSLSFAESKKKDASVPVARTHAPSEGVCYHEYTQKFDVYSFGITLWEMVECGKQRPFESAKLRGDPLTDYIMAGNRPPFSDKFTEKCRALIERCWSERREQRPTMKKVLSEVKKLFSVKC